MQIHNHPAVAIAMASAPTMAHQLNLTSTLQSIAAGLTIVYMALSIWNILRGKK